MSAYANYNDGTILFGVDDNGCSLNLEDLNTIALNIENKINDSITPRPEYQLEIDEDRQLVVLKVFEGSINLTYIRTKRICDVIHRVCRLLTAKS